MWRVAAFGDLCTDTALHPGDILALGRPGDEGLLAVLYAHAAAAFPQRGQLRLLGGSHHRCVAKAMGEVRCTALPLQEYLNLLPHSDAILSSTDGIRSCLLNTPWCAAFASKEVDALAFAFKPSVLAKGERVMEDGNGTSTTQ